MENVKILIANTGMDTDKIKVGGPQPAACDPSCSGVRSSEPASCPVPDLWLQGPRGLDREGRRDRTGREGEDEGEGGSNHQARNQLFHQQVHTHTQTNTRVHTHAYSHVSSRGRPCFFSASSSSTGS